MRPDTINPNLPARDFTLTSHFYQALGFEEAYRDPYWMIMTRGPLVLEFFPYPDLDPYQSSFGVCVRVSDVDGIFAAWASAKLPAQGVPRMTSVENAPWGSRHFALVDLDGSLLRVMEPIN